MITDRIIISDILTPARTLCSVHGVSKKKILEVIAGLISEELPSINAKHLLTALISRERLGATGIGGGVALPRCRSKACIAPTGLFLRLTEPVDFESMDQKPVDLIFALIVPEGNSEKHMEILKILANRFKSEDLLNKMREADNRAELYHCITS
ncbi:MAG: PTS sugar transporter subunit IIA [Candidatus Endonucleobacter sp. (ex Gigantidas childressi)]|nr:PTS sugar transporter subunit IIA [Candidatus Endonucleobacter sp. (ex Gigantidas childressi)]